MNGEVVRHEKTEVTKRVREGIGENVKEKTVQTEGFALTVLGVDGQRLRIVQETPFEMEVGEAVTLELRYGLQTKLDGGDEEDGKKKRGK